MYCLYLSSRTRFAFLLSLSCQKIDTNLHYMELRWNPSSVSYSVPYCDLQCSPTSSLTSLFCDFLNICCGWTPSKESEIISVRSSSTMKLSSVNVMPLSFPMNWFCFFCFLFLAKKKDNNLHYMEFRLPFHISSHVVAATLSWPATHCERQNPVAQNAGNLPFG